MYIRRQLRSFGCSLFNRMLVSKLGNGINLSMLSDILRKLNTMFFDAVRTTKALYHLCSLGHASLIGYVSRKE